MMNIMVDLGVFCKRLGHVGLNWSEWIRLDGNGTEWYTPYSRHSPVHGMAYKVFGRDI